ncbi:PucR family transcriptional regulator [Falseniella ignava]|uniref:PucR family transcriptional regulator n=1 Tax=Falseniella ignava CCUG 37419 TaxID=883112 RepID=K1LUG4_9LACT|nr:PucR family transcriptional regulator [Falseniella ignava]EKB55757.1 hypothetical protein HMPREF9707_00944 [Falseniella ignava CCUG 37419]
MVLLREIFSHPFFDKIDIATDRNVTLNKEVTSVVLSEVPDIEKFIKPGVVVVTTGIIYKDMPDEMMKLIDSLKRVHAVALGFKVGRFFDEIPQNIVDYADEQGLLVFRVPEGIFLIDVVNQIQNMIQGTDDLSFALNIQKQLTDLIFREASQQFIIDRFAEIVGTPVLLISPYYSLEYASKDINKGKNKSIIDRVLSFLRDQKIEKEMSIRLPLEDSDQQVIRIRVISLKTYQHHPHYLVILHPEQLPYPISAFTFEQVAVSMSFALYKDRKEAATEHAIQSEYYRRLMGLSKVGRVPDESLLTDLNYGILPTNYYQVIRIGDAASLGLPYNSSYEEEKMEILAQWLRTYAGDYLKGTVVFEDSRSDSLYLILQQYTKKLNATLHQIQERIEADLKMDIYFCLGNTYLDLSKLGLSCNEANIVYDEVQKRAAHDIVNYLDNNVFYHLFGEVNSDVVKYYCQSVLKELAYPKDKQMIELRNTLKTYLGNQCEISTTAKELFVHRNTVIYRIQKCEEMLEYSVSAPRNSLNIRLALELSE